jgi:hypothetical protein
MKTENSKLNAQKEQLDIPVVISRFSSCANCRALIHNIGGGFSCYLRKQYTHTDREFYDRRLDAYVKQKPLGNCKVKTIKVMVQNGL